MSRIHFNLLTAVVLILAAIYTPTSPAAESAMKCSAALTQQNYPIDIRLRMAGPPEGVYSLAPRQEEIVAIIEEAAKTGASLMGAVSLLQMAGQRSVPFAGKIIETNRFKSTQTGTENLAFLVETPAGRSWFFLSTGKRGTFLFNGDLFSIKQVDSFKPYSTDLNRIDQYAEAMFEEKPKHIVVISNDEGPSEMVRIGTVVGPIGFYEKFLRYDDYLFGFWSRRVTQKVTYLPFAESQGGTEHVSLDTDSRATIYKIEGVF